jgi:hypothetical protein
MAKQKYYRRKCMSCNYFCVFELVQEDDEAYELCTHCETKSPIKISFADAHMQQCENWLENQGRMWPKTRPRIALLDRPGAFTSLFGKLKEEALEYQKQREEEAAAAED